MCLSVFDFVWWGVQRCEFCVYFASVFGLDLELGATWGYWWVDLVRGVESSW